MHTHLRRALQVSCIKAREGTSPWVLQTDQYEFDCKCRTLNLVAHIVLFVAEPYRPSPSTEDTTLCGIEPALDSVCVHTRRDAVVSDNPEAEAENK